MRWARTLTLALGLCLVHPAAATPSTSGDLAQAGESKASKPGKAGPAGKAGPVGVSEVTGAAASDDAARAQTQKAAASDAPTGTASASPQQPNPARPANTGATETQAAPATRAVEPAPCEPDNWPSFMEVLTLVVVLMIAGGLVYLTMELRNARAQLKNAQQWVTRQQLADASSRQDNALYALRQELGALNSASEARHGDVLRGLRGLGDAISALQLAQAAPPTAEPPAPPRGVSAQPAPVAPPPKPPTLDELVSRFTAEFGARRARLDAAVSWWDAQGVRVQVLGVDRNADGQWMVPRGAPESVQPRAFVITDGGRAWLVPNLTRLERLHDDFDFSNLQSRAPTAEFRRVGRPATGRVVDGVFQRESLGILEG